MGLNLSGLDLRSAEKLPRAGSVVPTDRAHPPFVVLDRVDIEITAVTEYLAELALGDSRPLTCRSYAYDLLRWFRVLWLLDIDLPQATQSEVAVMVGWLRTAPNRQHQRRNATSPGPGQSTSTPASRLSRPGMRVRPSITPCRRSAGLTSITATSAVTRWSTRRQCHRSGGQRWPIAGRWSQRRRSGAPGCGSGWPIGHPLRFRIGSRMPCSTQWGANASALC